jgi:hypothetical protein
MAPSPAFEGQTTMRDLVFWTWAVGGTPLALALTGLAMGRLRDGIRGLVSTKWLGILRQSKLPSLPAGLDATSSNFVTPFRRCGKVAR